ncbi:MAG: hypothetical protein LBG79_08135, partial [Spirochaetaceae bacterium]|nr:hypothetical protein [Spirochaetaceae bacterium]
MKLKTGIINQITFTLIMLFLTGTAFAETLLFRGSPEVSIYSTAEQGYGGAYSAYGKDIFTLFNNPALLSILQEGSIVGLGFEFPVNQNDFKELAKLFEKKSIEDSKLNDYIEKQLSFAPPYASVQGPLMFGITGKSASFGFFNRSFISSNLEYFENETIPDDTVLYRAYLHNDIIAVAGTAINLINGELHKLDLGADFKLFTRISSVLNEAKTSIPKDEDRKTTDSGGGGDRVLVGTGFDLGLLYSYGDRFSFGITARNVPCGALVIQSKEKEKAEEGFLFLPVINTGISFSLINNYFLVCNLL